jgi:hypothetical protein
MQSLRMVVLVVVLCVGASAWTAVADTFYELGIPDGGGGFVWETISPLLFPDPGNPGQFLDCADFYDWAPPAPFNLRAEFGSTRPAGPGTPRQWGLDNLDDNLLTCFLYGDDVTIPIQLFLIYGHPANDGDNFIRHQAVLNISGLPATATDFAVYDDVMSGADNDEYGDGDDIRVFTVTTIVGGDTTVVSQWTEYYTDGFVITDLEPLGPTDLWYYDIPFDLDFIDVPITGVQWLTGDINNPTLAHGGVFGYTDDLGADLPGDTDWILRITPEPATTALFVTGLSSLGLYIRRRRKKS